MASNMTLVNGEQCFVCPVCLGVFEDATILSCGHSFCKKCLEEYDKNKNKDHIVCPTCRKRIRLGVNRVSGLTPNYSMRGVEEKLRINKHSEDFCSLHSEIYMDIFCEDCGEFICLTCYLKFHNDHEIKKKEELQGYLRKKTEKLIEVGKTRRSQIEESVNKAEKHTTEVCSNLSNVEKEIRDESAKKVTTIQQNEEILVKKLDSIRKENENQLEGFRASQKQAIDYINNSITLLRSYTTAYLDSDTLKAQHSQCTDLEKSLHKVIDEKSIALLQQTAESTRFRPSDEKLIALGHIEVGVKEISNIEQVKTATGANRKLELTARNNVAVIPPPVRSKSLNIVGQVEAPHCICCMAAAQSQDAVVVGYGGNMFVENRPGSDRFSVSGEKTKHLKSEVGEVWDIAFLTDGRSVVSHDDYTLRVYSTNGHSTCIQYRCNKGSYYVRLCVDQDDNICALDGHQKIYIFHGNNPNPQTVNLHGYIETEQICATKTGAFIIRSRDKRLCTWTVFGREGHEGSSIRAMDYDEYQYATVDSQDRVLIGGARYGSDVLRLTRYTLQGIRLIQEVAFNQLKLPRDVIQAFRCMTSLTPKLIAFANDQNLYFIELSE